MNFKEFETRLTTLYSVIYEKDGNRMAQVSNTELQAKFNAKKLELQGYKIVEIKKIECKSENFTEVKEKEIDNIDVNECKKLKEQIEKDLELGFV